MRVNALDARYNRSLTRDCAAAFQGFARRRTKRKCTLRCFTEAMTKRTSGSENANYFPDKENDDFRQKHARVKYDI